VNLRSATGLRAKRGGNCFDARINDWSRGHGDSAALSKRGDS